jgi:hypothetical protein
MWLSEHKVVSVEKTIDESGGGREVFDADFIGRKRCIGVHCERRCDLSRGCPARLDVVCADSVGGRFFGGFRECAFPRVALGGEDPIRSARINSFRPPIGQS